MATATKKTTAAPVKKAAKPPTTKKTTTATKSTVKKPGKTTVAPAKRSTVKAPPSVKRAGKTPVAKKSTPAVKATPKRVIRPTIGVNFRPGSDAEVVWGFIQAGGASRKEVQEKIEAHFAGVVTRGGQPKPISTVMNQVIRRAVADGWVFDSTWKMVKPDAAPTAKGPHVKKVKKSTVATPLTAGKRSKSSGTRKIA